ncbi:MAG: DUF4058 family protein [Planctomycetota bacterium]
MKSPFPGMDPWLEQHWRSVHHRLVTYAGDQLQRELPRRFRVEVEERVFVLGDPEGNRFVTPDLYVVQRSKPKRTGAPSENNTAIAEPLVIELADEPITEIYLEIVDTALGNQVVTALEFLSPTNKCPGDGCDMYVKKQREYRVAGVNQVEIDLTRSGNRGLVFPMTHIPREHRTLYLACVRRSEHPTKIEAYPIPLQTPLPTLGVPLGADVADVPLELQSLVTQCYQNGRYGDIDYGGDVSPPLPPDDASWADRRLREEGLR